MGPTPRSEQSYQLWYVIVCDLETSAMRRPWSALGCCAKTEEFVGVIKVQFYRMHGVNRFKIRIFISVGRQRVVRLYNVLSISIDTCVVSLREGEVQVEYVATSELRILFLFFVLCGVTHQPSCFNPTMAIVGKICHCISITLAGSPCHCVCS
jgi:hypothetical protein